jgi:integrase/recombinase XerC
MLMETALEDFQLNLAAERGYSPRTAQSYLSDLRSFSAYACREGWDGTVEQVTAALIRSWMTAMKEEGRANATIARRLHGLRAFWRFLTDSELVDSDPTRKIAVPKYPRPLPEFLHADELRALLDAAQRNHSVLAAFRNYALIAVAIYTGLRRSELINLQLNDFDVERRVLRVNGKGGRWRVVPLAEEACDALMDWLELRPAEAAHDYIFTTTHGNRIYPGRMQRIWRAAAPGSRMTGRQQKVPQSPGRPEPPEASQVEGHGRGSQGAQIVARLPR